MKKAGFKIGKIIGSIAAITTILAFLFGDNIVGRIIQSYNEAKTNQNVLAEYDDEMSNVEEVGGELNQDMTVEYWVRKNYPNNKNLFGVSGDIAIYSVKDNEVCFTLGVTGRSYGRDSDKELIWKDNEEKIEAAIMKLQSSLLSTEEISGIKEIEYKLLVLSEDNRVMYTVTINSNGEVDDIR